MGLQFILSTTASTRERRRSSVPFLVVSLFLLATFFGCPHSGCADLPTVYLPKDLVVVDPGPAISPAIGSLAGAWEGKWSNGAVSALVVYKVEKDSARVFHSFAENREYLAWHEWARARVVHGDRPRLEWKTSWAAFSFELSDDGRTLSGLFLETTPGGNGTGHTAAMTTREIARVDHNRPRDAFVCPAIGRELGLIEQEQIPSKRQAMVNSLVERARKLGTPLVEPGQEGGRSCAAFIYHGSGREIAIAGFMNGWSRHKNIMSRVAETGLYYYCEEYPADSRIEYQFFVDEKPILDPLCPKTSVYGKGSSSEARMPAYVPPPEIEPDPAVPRGIVEDLNIDSRRTAMRRTATVYLPVGYPATTERYPVLYLNDAFGAIKFGKITVILDNLIQRKVIPPVIAVLLPSARDRIAEYGMNPEFEAFFIEDVVPSVDRRYRTRPSPEFRAVGGISAGATAGLSLALHHPGIFGKCMAQSTATNLVPLIDLARTGPSRPVSVYLDVGRFETDFYGRDLVDASRRIRDALRSRNCPVHYREVNDGHGWASWRARTTEALTFLFGQGN